MVHINQTGTGGSSPRVWGTSTATDRIRGYTRFIPTCVGNIVILLLKIDTNTVHPHVCGEHALFIFRYRGNDGSSPRVWGTLFV